MKTSFYSRKRVAISPVIAAVPFNASIRTFIYIGYATAYNTEGLPSDPPVRTEKWRRIGRRVGGIATHRRREYRSSETQSNRRVKIALREGTTLVDSPEPRFTFYVTRQCESLPRESHGKNIAIRAVSRLSTFPVTIAGQFSNSRVVVLEFPRVIHERSCKPDF